ncbi:MAG: hypothetical protein GEU73_06065 [Chloroflexi bacterium]|nr:hypothetical protein [Chloroflexota bacterium]
MAEFFELTERMSRTADGRLVPEGDPAGRTFFGGPGTRIPLADAERSGLIKIRSQPEDKMRERGEDKSTSEPMEAPRRRR